MYMYVCVCIVVCMCMNCAYMYHVCILGQRNALHYDNVHVIKMYKV